MSSFSPPLPAPAPQARTDPRPGSPHSSGPSPTNDPDLLATLQRHWQKFPTTPLLWACLLGITLFGAVLRFWRLGYQAYWTDEAYTLQRIGGSFAYMLSQLSDQGFPPGWYALLRLWRIFTEGHVARPGDAYLPEYTRQLPALLGTLTIPAMYFLARQFTDRKGALLVMLLTAVNPYLIYYSRDIKMYGGFWFFIILNSALFFHWQTTRKHLLWFPLYLLTGVFMTAMHPMAWFIVALHLIFLLTRPRPRPFDAPLWVLAAGAMAWLPIYWFLDYLPPARWIGRVTTEDNRGMNWIADYTDMSWRTIASLPTSQILGYLWPVYPPDARLIKWFKLGTDFNAHLATRSWPALARGQWLIAVILLAVLFLGLIPWRGLHRNPQPLNSCTRGRSWWIALWIVLPTFALALTWIPTNSPWHDLVWQGFNPKPMWEPRYLGLILPALLLWLGASLRRFPTFPLRVLLVTFFTLVCFISSLSNHLIYRNPPLHVVAELLERHVDKRDRDATIVGISAVAYPDPAQDVAITNARGIVPASWQDRAYSPKDLSSDRTWSDKLSDESKLIKWLGSYGNDPSTRTILMVDKYSDDPNSRLSDDAVARLLGPRWHLVEEQSCVWHYEWRFYIFHTWRIRCWQLTSGSPTQR